MLGTSPAHRDQGKIAWPDGKRFAFTVFDDTDKSTIANVGSVYALLGDLGFRTTKSAWVVRGDPNQGRGVGTTCEDPDYCRWVQELQSRGFEIGWHSSTWHGLPRPQILAALEKFKELFHHDPVTAAHHGNDEGIYWGRTRVSGVRRWVYDALTGYRRRNKFRGHVEDDPYFWGDLCQARIKYYRNFIFHNINTLRCCPFMPYHDPQRPFVNYWFASSDGHDMAAYNRCLSEANQDRLEAEGGACIMYTHFANGFTDGGKINPRFQQLSERLSRKNGWFVPLATLLDHLLAARGHHEITAVERRRLEWKWLAEKMILGTN